MSAAVRWVGPMALLALVVTSGAAWIWFTSNSNQQQTVAAQPNATAGTPVSPPPARTGANNPAPPGKPVGSPQRFVVALPTVSQVRFRTHRAQVTFSLLALRQEPRDGGMQVLTVLVRMTTRGPLDEAFNSDQFRLIAADREIAPTKTFHSAVEANAAEETTLDFVLPAIVEPLLEVRVYAESTRVPISLAARTALANDPSLDEFGQPRRVRVVDAMKELPASLAAGQRVEVGKLGFQIVDAVIERETVETASLALTVRCSVPRAVGGGGANFWSGTVRLWIDGVPRPPVNRVNVVVGPGDSRDERFVFDLLALPQTLEVGIFNANDSAKVALSLAPLIKR